MTDSSSNDEALPKVIFSGPVCHDILYIMQVSVKRLATPSHPKVSKESSVKVKDLLSYELYMLVKFLAVCFCRFSLLFDIGVAPE